MFRRKYCRRHKIGTGKYLSEVSRNARLVIRRGDVKVELYRMASNRSMRTGLSYKALWKYRAIRNPYINAIGSVTRASETQDDPLLDIRKVQPIASAYNNEIYLSNRILAFERDGWKCTRCRSQENLQAHHTNPVPKGTFNLAVVHRLENLQTPCAKCHNKVPKMQPNQSAKRRSRQ